MLCFTIVVRSYQLEEPQKSVVMVITPLTAILEDQVSWFSLYNTRHVIIQSNPGSSRGLSVAAVNRNTTAAVKASIFNGKYTIFLDKKFFFKYIFKNIPNSFCHTSQNLKTVT